MFICHAVHCFNAFCSVFTMKMCFPQCSVPPSLQSSVSHLTNFESILNNAPVSCIITASSKIYLSKFLFHFLVLLFILIQFKTITDLMCPFVLPASFKRFVQLKSDWLSVPLNTSFLPFPSLPPVSRTVRWWAIRGLCEVQTTSQVG